MVDCFNDYLRKLQDLENAENIASLRALQKMNEGVLSFFPSIWESINNLISSNSVNIDVIDDIKKHLPSLSNCKRHIDTLSSSEKSKFYANNIVALLHQRYALIMYETEIYEQELLDMIHQNRIKLDEEKDIAEVEKKEEEESERRAKIEKEKVKQTKKKEPKQYLQICISDISSNEYIEVFVDGIKDSSSSRHARNDILSGGYWNMPLTMSKGEHKVTLLFNMSRLKLELYVPKIDFINKKGRKINKLDYDIRSSSIIGKKWTSDTSKIDVTVRLDDSSSWFLGEKIKPNYSIVQI